jgi:penicillin G amidase
MVGSVWLAVAVLSTQETDAYGVRRISGPSVEAVMRGLGEAHVEDRLWQMEMSRRIARGTMAEVAGASALESDRQTRRMGYRADELRAMVDALPSQTRALLTAYRDGANDALARRVAANQLPGGYAQMNFRPAPWSLEDTAAIAVMMISRFGTGGAGELRNLAMLEYAKISPARSRPFDLLDELAWHRDPDGIPTLSAEDDLSRNAIAALTPAPSRDQTEAQYAALPKAVLLELLPAIRVADYTDQKLLAAHYGVVPKAGSYAMVVSPSRSSNGRALLLSAPQMGHSVPSPVYEACLDAPGYQVQGISIPGVPGIVIGHTPRLAWGLTSGVADCEDIYGAFAGPNGGYLVDGAERPTEKWDETIKVAGGESVTLTVERTEWGPVLLRANTGDKPIYSVRKSFWKRELQAMSEFLAVPRLTTAREVLDQAGRFPVTFNVFAADVDGNIGYRYAGAFPIRRPDLDPRLPIPADGNEAWPRMATPQEMPHAYNPKAGVILNWNNKPIRDWPSMDTPVWGPVFRNEALVRAMGDGPWSTADLVLAAKEIAEAEDTTSGLFRDLFLQAIGDDPAFAAAKVRLTAFDGSFRNGDENAAFYLQCVSALRRNGWLSQTGNFTSEQFFSTVIQPSTMMRAIRGRSALGIGVAAEMLRKSVADAMAAPPGPTQRGGLYAGQPYGPVPYGNRGTFIQVVSLGAGSVRGMTVLGSGNTESGEHSADQVPLVARWRLKPSFVSGLRQ